MKRTVFIAITMLWVIPLHAQKVLQLEDCRQMALSHNISLQMASENVKAAHQLTQAAFTQFLPNFSAMGSYSWNEKNISLLAEDALLPVGTKMSDGSFGFTPAQVSNGWTLVNGQPVPLDASGKPFDPHANPDKILWKNYAILPKESMEFDTKNIFIGGISMVQPVYLGGKIRELYRISKYSEQLAVAKQENQTAELLVEVDEAYWRVVSLKSKVDLAREYRDLLMKVDTNVSIMIAEGTATKADALRVKVKLSETDISLTKAENGLVLSRMALNQLCGMPADDNTPLADQELDIPIKIAELPAIDKAISNRPEIHMLTQAENIAKSGERLMVSRFLPNIALTGNYLVSNPNMYNGYEKKFAGMFNVGVVANVPIFHFGDKLHTLKAAKIEHSIASLKLQDAKEKIELQISQSSFRVNESIKQQLETEHNISLAEENLRTANEGFEAGVITSTDLLGAQAAWLSAKSENIDAKIDSKLCTLYLQKALGNLK
ncbi:MAG: TolC family protein [Bacteroidota bacterium]